MRYDDREIKLPKWAQEKLGLLRMRLTEAAEHIQEYGDVVEGPRNIVIHPYSDHALTLKPDARVELNAEGVKYVVRLGRKHNGLNIYATETLHLEMSSSNCLWVRPADRHVYGND